MILQGHLEDLDMQQAEELTQRELLRDQDADLPTTDEDFATEYHNHRSRLQRSLKSVQAEAEALRSTCESYGLDIDQAKWRLSNPHRLSSPSTRRSLDLSTNTATVSPGQNFNPSLFSMYRPVDSDVNRKDMAFDLAARFERLRPTPLAASKLPPTSPDLEANQTYENLPVRVEPQASSFGPTSPKSTDQFKHTDFAHRELRQSQSWNERLKRFDNRS